MARRGLVHPVTSDSAVCAEAAWWENTALSLPAPQNASSSCTGRARDIFAYGAMRAALWADDKPPGLYTIADVMGLADELS